jgi:hypothetical protein
MFKLGRTQLPALKCFGVSEVLGEEAEVFYHALFNAQHLGKVSDLLVARLKKSGTDEVRFRISITLSLFQAYRGQVTKKNKESLQTPLVLECGIDREKVAVGVLFKLSDDMKINFNGISDRIASNQPLDAFEEVLVKLYDTTDRVILKHQPESKKIEIVSMIGIEGKIDPSEFKEKAPMTLVLFESNQVKEAPRPKSYVNLGDLDYRVLLKEDPRVKHFSPSATGEFLMPVKDVNSQEEEKIVVQSNAIESDNEVQVVRGKFEGENSDSIVVSGDDDSEIQDSRSWTLGKMVSGTGRAIKGFFNFILNRAEESPEEVSEHAKDPKDSTPEIVQELSDSAGTSESLNSISNDLSLPNKSENTEVQMEKMMNELDGENLNQLVKTVEEEIDVLRENSSDTKTVRWLENVMKSLISEKLVLSERARKLNAVVRAKDLEYKNEVTKLKDEIMAKSVQLLAKESALTQSKEALTQMSQSVGKFKTASQELTEEVQYKQQFLLSQKTLDIVREDNAKLLKKIDDLKHELSVDQKAGFRNQSASVEYSALLGRYERLYKQAEEFKKANRQLMDYLSQMKNSAKTSAAVAPDADASGMKRKMEVAMQLAAASKKEVEILKNRIIGNQKYELSLREQIEALKEELAQIKGQGNLNGQ